ncbi:hypothetical protein SAMN02745134_03760 [Clostridium acidisoli DSM 12555]|uniref:DUF6382 domain-containing protein n=1 Tax=Clostridium acidisoli DSM 12555 TaxID=1121291 RepID=A0A1W1XYL3_9CLOT|nr:DUF6382 domain-containing protein [Clostridium acidisoli]SMC29013.1 hypothetical protein SAMN02745134_03760 [Clostridium acidisoli DSM 12555]
MISKQKLSFREEVVSNKKCVSIDLEEFNDVVDFEINMIQNNPSLPFLDVKVFRLDNVTKLVYDVGRKETLEHFINSREFGKDIFFNIIESIMKTINSSNEFMLDNNKIILNLKYIFIDKNSFLIYMIFVPVDMRYEYSIEDEFANICKKILDKFKNIKKELSRNEKKIVGIINSRNFTFEKLEQAFYLYNKENVSELNYRKDIENTGDYDEILKEIDNKLRSHENYENQQNDDKNSHIEKSIIEENYKDIDGLDFSDFDIDDYENNEENDEELGYREYRDVQQLDKITNNKSNKLFILQLIVVMLIGSIVLLFSVDDKQFFIMVMSIMIFVLILLVVLIVLSFRKKRN